MARTLILIGILFILAGILWWLLARIGFGRLPGDIIIERDNLRIYIPITSAIILSVALSVVLTVIGYFLGE